jgi:hypothetical protein
VRPTLKVGERGRLDESGPVVVVERVSACAAYVRTASVRHVVIAARDGGPGRAFDARESCELPISPTAFLYPE